MYKEYCRCFSSYDNVKFMLSINEEYYRSTVTRIRKCDYCLKKAPLVDNIYRKYHSYIGCTHAQKSTHAFYDGMSRR
jgi:hypothetical protein